MSIADDVAAIRPSLFIASRMKRLAERMQAQTMTLIQAAGLPVQPSNVLLLAVLHEQGPQTITSLATALKLSQPTVTRAVGGLVDAGLLTLTRGKRDLRQRSVDLTAAGREMWERADRSIWTPVEQAVDGLLAGMTNDLLAGLAELETLLADRPIDQRVRRDTMDRTPLLPASPGQDRPRDRQRAPVLRWAATPADFGLCRELLDEHIGALHVPQAASYLDVTPASLRQTYGGDRAGVLFAELDGEPAGMLAFKPFDDHRAVINYFYVRSRARGHGVGRALMTTVLKEMKAAGHRGAVLSTLPRLATARTIYTAFGFTRTDPLYPDLPGAEYYELRW